jgi:hypothetical protein
MFASSLALLLRALDVPTRVASGYRFPSDPVDSGGRTITVRERDAHAWVEYYVPRFGWVKHDPTDGTREAAPALTQQIGQLLHWDQMIDRVRLLLLPALGLLLIVIGGAWTILDKRAATPIARLSASDIARAHVARTYSEAVRLVSRSLPSHRPPAEPARARAFARIPRACGARRANLRTLFCARRCRLKLKSSFLL